MPMIDRRWNIYRLPMHRRLSGKLIFNKDFEFVPFIHLDDWTRALIVDGKHWASMPVPVVPSRGYGQIIYFLFPTFRSLEKKIAGEEKKYESHNGQTHMERLVSLNASALWIISTTCVFIRRTPPKVTGLQGTVYDKYNA